MSRILVLVPALLALLAYVQCLNYPFVYDDLSGILGDPLISGSETAGQASAALFETWRPLTRFSYAVTHALFGFSRPIFHATNLIIHVLNTFLIFGIALHLARRWLPDIEPNHFGFIAAVIHSVHPLYTEAVTYVSGRSSSMCAMFYFGSVFLVMRAVETRDSQRRMALFAAAVLSGLFAWGAKEEAITLPLIVGVFLFLVGYRRAALLLVAIPPIVVAVRWNAIAALYRNSAANRALTELGVGTPVETSSYVLTQIKAAVLYYMTRFVMPLTQSVDPYVPTVRSIFESGLIISLAALGGLVFVAVHFRKRQPVITFSLAALLISPLLAYAVIPLADVVAEHRVYISGLGFNLLAALLLVQGRRLMWPSIAVLGMALMAVTIARNSVWSSDLRLWQQAETNAPNQVRPHLNYGAALQVAGELDRAIVEYSHALAIRSDLPLAYSNMGTIYLEQSRFDEAETMLKRAVELSPSMPRPYINLAAIAVHRKNASEALAYAARAETAGAASFWVHFLRGEVYAFSGDVETARAEYERAAAFVDRNSELKDEIGKRLAAMEYNRATRRLP